MGFHQFHRCRQVLLSSAIIDNLGITDRLPGRFAQPAWIGKEAADFIDQSGGEHGFHATVDADVQFCLRPVDDKHPAGLGGQPLRRTAAAIR